MIAFLCELEVDEYTPKAKSEQSGKGVRRLYVKSEPVAVATGSQFSPTLTLGLVETRSLPLPVLTGLSV